MGICGLVCVRCKFAALCAFWPLFAHAATLARITIGALAHAAARARVRRREVHGSARAARKDGRLAVGWFWPRVDVILVPADNLAAVDVLGREWNFSLVPTRSVQHQWPTSLVEGSDRAGA
jgi:hypothetical protein